MYSTKSSSEAQAKEALWCVTPSTVSEGWAEVFAAMPNPAEAPIAPTPDDLEGWVTFRADFNAPQEEASATFAKSVGVSIEEITLGGVPVLDVRPAGWVDDGRILVYAHGGAYTLLSARSMLLSASLNATTHDIRVLSIDFTPAPQAKWQAITDQVVAVFQTLIEQGTEMSKVAFYGDSAGGGLVGGSVLKMRDLGLTLPKALIMWSPWADIAEKGDTYLTLKHAEPSYRYERILYQSALAYADKRDHTHPYVSPVYGDFTKGFPPTLIQGGIREIFLSGFVRLYQALDTAGQEVKLDLYEGMPHVFQVARPDAEETQIALNKMGTFLDQHLNEAQ